MVIAQGDIFWVDFGEPLGSEPGYLRPVVIVQSDAFNRSKISTTLGVVITSQLKWAVSPGNVRLTARETGLDRDSVANVSQVVTIDRAAIGEHIGRVPREKLEHILDGIDLVIGR